MKISREIISQFDFGLFDGTVSVLGVIIGLAASPNSKIIAASVGLATAAAISMGFGEFLGDDNSGIMKAIAMAVATLFGTLIPILPFVFLPKFDAFITGGVLTFLLGTLISHYRDKGLKGYIQTYIMLIIAIGATILITMLIPGSGG